MKRIENPGRRSFLQGSAVASGVVVLSFSLSGVVRAAADEPIKPAGFRPNAFIRIGRDNVVTVVIGSSEMGQGVLTSLSQIVAEELDADWSKVRCEQAPAHSDYNRPGLQIMLTGGSSSVRSNWEVLRKAGASARHAGRRCCSDLEGRPRYAAHRPEHGDRPRGQTSDLRGASR
jgi:isoquinoline 1-oxidoreductase beta subunit